ncbi:hypothetical protein OG785_05825 [Streptomyces sp. NBC_00006]|uniref:hypothetical protein n=1 Tax=Streptomyces sp. NBC_00006 TaxID=2975619 RepID=UPI002259E0FB|nr:hypothetical protein [Streptomyces sp. NBC_00006]MCX5530074.1 hypothetical protein [Streptomyces sp. NBC_00006]
MGATFTLVFVYAGVTVLLPVTAALLLRATPSAELPDGEPWFAIGTALTLAVGLQDRREDNRLRAAAGSTRGDR